MSFTIPDACTLPTAERPLRLAEFDELFSTAVRAVEQTDATHARLFLSGPVGLADKVRDLTARETECCSFFAFTVTAEPAGQVAAGREAVVLDVAVPAERGAVLASLVAHARVA